MKRDQLEDRFGLVEFSLSQLIWGLKFEDRSLMLEVWSSKSKAVWGSQPEHTPWEPTGQMLPIKRFIWTPEIASWNWNWVASKLENP